MKLTPIMRDALSHISAHGGIVSPMSGGWWVIPGTPTRTQRDARGPYEVPDGWSILTVTLKALISRGLIGPIMVPHRSFALTPAGREAAR